MESRNPFTGTPSRYSNMLCPKWVKFITCTTVRTSFQMIVEAGKKWGRMGFTLIINVWTTMSWTCTKIFSILGGGQFFWRHYTLTLTLCFIFSNLCRALCTKFITWVVWLRILILVHWPRGWVTVKCFTLHFLLVCHTCLQLHNNKFLDNIIHLLQKNRKLKVLTNVTQVNNTSSSFQEWSCQPAEWVEFLVLLSRT